MAKASKKKAASKKAASKKKAEELESSELAIQPAPGSSALATIDPLFAETMSSGHEEVSADDMSTPFLAILQGLSPAVVKGSDVYDADAEAGDFIHTVSRELFSGEDGCVVLPCYYMKRWIEWVPRLAGGGFVRQYEQNEAPPMTNKGDINIFLDEDGSLWEGNEKDAPRQAVLTHMHFVVLMTESGPEPVMFTCTSTQLTPSARWNALAKAQRVQGNTLARFSTLYRLSTTLRQKDNNSWYVFGAGVERRLAPSTNGTDLELFNMAKEFKAAAIEDRLKVSHVQEGTSSNSQSAPQSEGFGEALEDAPF